MPAEEIWPYFWAMTTADSTGSATTGGDGGDDGSDDGDINDDFSDPGDLIGFGDEGYTPFERPGFTEGFEQIAPGSSETLQLLERDGQLHAFGFVTQAMLDGSTAAGPVKWSGPLALQTGVKNQRIQPPFPRWTQSKNGLRVSGER